MQIDSPNRLRRVFGWLALACGSLIGWGLVELAWRKINHGMHWHFRPERGLGYFVIAILCAISMGLVGLALVRLHDLPGGEGIGEFDP